MSVTWLEKVDSTNTYALEHLASLGHLDVIAAKEQTAGRGQRGNSWLTEAGKNLTFSIVLKFAPGQLAASEAHWLNYVASDAVGSWLRSLGVNALVKWPNDVYVGRAKICGILVENRLVGEWVASSVVGVGVNVNQREFSSLANATSLCLCTGREHSLHECLDGLMEVFSEDMDMLPGKDSRAQLFHSYSGFLFQKGVTARYHDYLQEREFAGIIRGVEPDGRLRITDLDTRTDRLYSFKEVGYIL